MRPRFSVRAPDHFGDGVMALPAVAALGGHAAAHGGRARVHARAWGGELYGWLGGVEVVPREQAPAPGTVGVLLKPSFGAAWRWRGLPERVGLAGNGRDWLLTRPLSLRDREHRRDGYARVAGACGAPVPAEARPCFVPRAPWDGPACAPGFIALNAWGRTPATRWPHMRALADLLVADGRPVVFLAGPGEGEPVRALAGAHTVVDHGPLAPLATFLDAAALVVSHDSGLAHFADACSARVRTLHGPTDPWVTGAGTPVVAGASGAASSDAAHAGGVPSAASCDGPGALRGLTAPPPDSGASPDVRVAPRVGGPGLTRLSWRVCAPRMADLSLARVHADVQAALASTV